MSSVIVLRNVAESNTQSWGETARTSAIEDLMQSHQNLWNYMQIKKWWIWPRVSLENPVYLPEGCDTRGLTSIDETGL